MNNNSIHQKLLNTRRQIVLSAYETAKNQNMERFLNGDAMATEEYIFENQKKDANEIINEFEKNNRRVISITKKTKVGMDGLIIEIAKLITTHPCDSFIIDYNNIRILTGMSNIGWEKDMKHKVPSCFKDKIFHHGQLKKAELRKLKNSLIIIDEIDSGNKEEQRLHSVLREANILDIKYMNDNNIRFVFTSATMIKELFDLYKWGDLHYLYKMCIPSLYISHYDFKELGIVQEFYPMNNVDDAEKWIDEDILLNYKDEYRVHLVRANNKNESVIQNACINKGIEFKNHMSDNKLSLDDIDELFNKPLEKHIIIIVKGLLRRANLIPNSWKIRIGAIHELYTKKVDNNVQIQGLIGRMTGYWKNIIENGHKTGPYRTSLKAIEEYEKTYETPFGENSYQTHGFKKTNGKVIVKHPTLISTHNVEHLIPVKEDTYQIYTVPIVIKVTEYEYKSFNYVNSVWDVNSIFEVIGKYNKLLVEELKRINELGGKDQIVQPQSDTSYNQYILIPCKACEEQKHYKRVGNIDNENNMDTFQIFLDNKEYRVIISCYYGSKRIMKK
jgi:hypothetical protein